MYDLRADKEIAVYQKRSVLFGVNAIDFSLSGKIQVCCIGQHTQNVASRNSSL